MALAKRLKAVLDGQSKDIFLKKKHGRDPILVKASSGATTIFLGALVTKKGETEGTPEVDLCAKGEPVDGIIVGVAWDVTNLKNDSDDPYEDGTYLWMEEIEEGDEFLVTAKTNTAVAFKDRLQADGGYVIPFAYAAGSIETDTLVSVIGTAQDSCGAVAATETIILARGGAR